MEELLEYLNKRFFMVKIKEVNQLGNIEIEVGGHWFGTADLKEIEKHPNYIAFSISITSGMMNISIFLKNENAN